jgi:hypothetical protein
VLDEGQLRFPNIEGILGDTGSDSSPDLFDDSKLPKDCEHWDLLRHWGIETSPDPDLLFFKVRYPTGWYRVRSGSPNYAYIFDDQDRLRIIAHYFNDNLGRHAWMQINFKRYCVQDVSIGNEYWFTIYDQTSPSLQHVDIYESNKGKPAYLKTDPTKLGFIINDIFYWDAKRVPAKSSWFSIDPDWSTVFTKKDDPNNAQEIEINKIQSNYPRTDVFHWKSAIEDLMMPEVAEIRDTLESTSGFGFNIPRKKKKSIFTTMGFDLLFFAIVSLFFCLFVLRLLLFL